MDRPAERLRRPGQSDLRPNHPALGLAAPSQVRLGPGEKVVLEAVGLAEPVEWRIEFGGDEDGLALSVLPNRRALLSLAGHARADSIVFLRATSGQDPRATTLTPIRLITPTMPAPKAAPNAATRAALRPQRQRRWSIFQLISELV